MIELLQDEIFLRELTQFSMIFAMIINITVGLAFFYYYIIRKKSLYLWFSLSWLIYGLSHIFKIIKLEKYFAYLSILSNLFTSISIIFLIFGIFAYLGLKSKKTKKLTYLFSTILIAISIIFPLLSLPTIWSRIPIYFSYGFAEIALGLILLRKEKKYSFLPAFGLILWGIHKLDHPFLIDTAFSPFGYTITFILGLIVAIGLMIMLSLREYSEIIDISKMLNSAYEKLKIQGKNISKLLLVISHNLRTPLTSLSEACGVLKIKLESGEGHDNLISEDLTNMVETNITRIRNELMKIENLIEFLDFSNTSILEPVKLSELVAELIEKLKDKSLLNEDSIINQVTAERFIYVNKDKLNSALFSLFTLLRSKNLLMDAKFVIEENDNSIIFCFKDLKNGEKLSFIETNYSEATTNSETDYMMLDQEIFAFINDVISIYKGKIYLNKDNNFGRVELCVELPKYTPE